jgi:peptidoglycan hydrolase-like protein with peptidoglycan-binding domain
MAARTNQKSKSKSVRSNSFLWKATHLTGQRRFAVAVVIIAVVASVGTAFLKTSHAFYATDIPSVYYCKTQGVVEYSGKGYNSCAKTAQAWLNYEYRITYAWRYWDVTHSCNSDYSLAVDGYFGAKSAAKTKCFQGWKGASRDGVIGPVTWGKMLDECWGVTTDFYVYGHVRCYNSGN